MKRALLLCGLLSTACVARAPVVRLPTTTPVAAALLLESNEGGALRELPAAVREAVAEELAERNLQLQPVAIERWRDTFAQVHDSDRRLAHLADHSEAPFVMLLETRARFFALISGRYKWTVYLKISLLERGSASHVQTLEVDFPALLDFVHEQEEAALATTASLIAGRVGRASDRFLSGRGGAPAVEAASATLPAARRGCPGCYPAPPAIPDGDLIYFVLLDRFANGDTRNDGAVAPDDPAGWHGGDIRGVIDKLDTLHALGVRTLWLSPLFACQHDKIGEHGAFHGYWVEDLNALEPRFGNDADLAALAEAVHARGMRLVLDLVLNHVGYDAPLRKQHPDWFHNLGDITAWDDPVQVVNHDVHGLPDLAQEKPAVYDYLLATSRGWIERADLDGFRLDAVKHVPIAFWQRFNREVKAQAGERFLLLGEMYDGDGSVTAAVQRQGGFGAMFDFALYFGMRDALCGAAPLGKLAAQLAADTLHDNPPSQVTFLDNHDLPRIASVCNGDLAALARALTVQFAIRGVPALTYGIEAALTGEGEPANRADLYVGDGAAPRPELGQLITSLSALRRSHPELQRGFTRVLQLDERALLFARLSEDAAFLVAVAGAGGGATINLPAALIEAAEPRDALSGKPVAGSTIEVAAGTVRLLHFAPSAPGAFATLLRRWRAAPQRQVVVRAERTPDLAGTLVLTGLGQEFGNWQADAGVRFGEGSGSAKTAHFTLPEGGVFEVKLALVGGEKVVWEESPNRYLFVPPGEGALEITMAWGAPARS